LAILVPATAEAATGYGVVGQFGGGPGYAPLLPLGVAVDQAGGDVYVSSAGGVVDKFDSAGDFVASWGWGVSDGQAQYEVCTSDCQAGITGSGADQFSLPVGLAVDSSTGDVYVADYNNGVVDKFDSSGNPIPESQFSLTLPTGSEPWGVAVDPKTGNLYVGDWATKVVDAFTSAGAPVDGIEIVARAAKGIAVDSSGNVYVATETGNDLTERAVQKFDASGNLVKTLDPGLAAGVAVDEENDDVFVNDQTSVDRYDAAGNQLGVIAGPESGSVSLGLAVNGSTKQVYFPDLLSGAVYVLGQVTLPDVTTGSATDLTTAGATLTGTINPEGRDTQYHFEYGTDTKYGTQIPASDAEVGSDSTAHAVSQSVTGLTSDQTYHYRLVAVVHGFPTYGPDQTYTTEPLPTVVTTGAATNLSTTTATLNGAINPEGLDTQYHFEYGTDTKYGSQIPVADGEVGSDSTTHAISELLTGLTPHQNYHYRLVGVVQGNHAYGPDQTFTTEALPTVVTTGAATNLTTTAATLTGSINPEGLDTQYHFEWGPDANYGSQIPASDAEVGSDSTAHAVSETLTGLTPHHTYHYRLVAVVQGFRVDGDDETVTVDPLRTIVTTGSATRVGWQSVTLSGTVNPMGLDTQYHIDYGPDTSYGRQAPAVQDAYVGAGNRSVAVSDPVAGLAPGTTYHYRTTAYVRGIAVHGKDATFTTKPLPAVLPTTVKTGVPGAVSQSGVTLTGSIDPHGLETGYYFEWGSDATYEKGHVRAVDTQVGPRSGARVVRQRLDGPFLTPGVTYHYRLAAMVAGTRVYGADRTLTTPATPLPAGIINVMNAPYSAAGDGKTNDRSAIQDALNAASSGGGGTVLLPAGHTFVSGGVTIPSHATLDIEGTLLQSKRIADYAKGTAWVDPPPGGIADNSAAIMDPMVLALDAQDVTLTGHGTIKMQLESGIPMAQIGFSHVTNFAIRDVHVEGGFANFAVAVFNSTHGILADTVQTAYPDFYQDALAIVSSEYVRVTNNYIASSGEGAYVADDYMNATHVGSLWIRDALMPARYQLWDHNYFTSTYPYGPVVFGNLPWGDLWTQAPDQRKVEISDIDVRDNTIVAPAGGDAVADQGGTPENPTTRMRFVDNTYIGPTFGPVPQSGERQWGIHTPSAVTTDSVYDYPGVMNSAAFQNPGFQQTGDAWWTTVGNAGATTDATPPPTPEDGTGTSWAGYALGRRGGPSELFQGLGMPAGMATFDVDVRIHGQATLFARDTCTGKTLATKTLKTQDWGRAHLAIHEPADCQDVQIGVRVDGAGKGANWAMIDNASLESAAAAVPLARTR
jgi:DNA-binding beta-propeller fold protein YncE